MMESKTVGKEDLVCSMCGHKWTTRPYRFKDERESPFKCPKCGSRYWWA